MIKGSAVQLSIPQLPVKINVKTTIDHEETFELVLFGQYYKKENASYLQYEEVMEEGSVRTIVKMTPGEGLILRSGAVKMRLPFQVNRKMNGSYEMPFGRFETTTKTKKIEHSFDNGQGRIDILYDFTMQGSPAGTYHLEITFQEDMK
jgi:uncharacterized beta-barrel protein YwiB (DUF1934 family)